LGRLAALSDNIFSVAMTLLVLSLHEPVKSSIHSELGLLHSVLSITPQLVTFLMSFLSLGLFWSGQQTQLNHLSYSDRHLTWIHLAFLCPVSLMPFSTLLLAQYIHYRTALLVYWLNNALLGWILFAGWRYAGKVGLYKDTVTHELSCAMERRIIVGQLIYAGAAALCFVDPWISIGVIVLAQLNFAIAPNIKWLSKI